MPDEIEKNKSRPNAQIRKFVLAAVVLSLGFSLSLWKLASFALHDELFSYILLIPFTSVYLARLQAKKLPALSLSGKTWANIFFIAGLAALAAHFLKPATAVADSLVLPTLAFILFLTGAGFLFLGGAMMRALAFPFALLVFMIPFSNAMRDGIETWLQHGSAAVAGWMFAASGLPVFHDDLLFHLPSVTLQVAPECSGIHSTLVLFIVSLVAAHFFLKSPWKCVVLCLAVIPLALLRNGFRVFVLGELCEHISPAILDSPIHHHGGPLFFALSLLPFSLLLYFLMKSERPKNPEIPPATQD